MAQFQAKGVFVSQTDAKGSQQGPEVPQLPPGRSVESIPNQRRVHSSVHIKHHRTQVMKEVRSLDQNRPVRHPSHVVDLLLLPLVPGFSFIPGPTLIFGHLKDQFQHPGTNGLFDRPPSIGIGNILQIVVEQGGGQDLITGAEPSEDANNTNQMSYIGDALLVQGISTRLTGRRLNSLFAKLMKMTPGRQTHSILKHP